MISCCLAPNSWMHVDKMIKDKCCFELSPCIAYIELSPHHDRSFVLRTLFRSFVLRTFKSILILMMKFGTTCI